jgi:hypothetical protein
MNKISGNDWVGMIMVAMFLTWCTAIEAIETYEKTHICPTEKAEGQ